ncbi:MAG: ADP-ribosylglycohydrolase family protein [Dermatophilaceae bacterium]
MTTVGSASDGMTNGVTMAERSRAAGVLLGQACGDALGVPYEFAAPLRGEASMIGGGLGPYAPGQWSDDTEMAVCIARVSATGVDLTSAAADDAIAEGFEEWLRGGARDVGAHTRALLVEARRLVGSAGERVRTASVARHARTGHTAGNGALMRTGIVGISRLNDREMTAASARSVASLTHADPLAGDSCVLWAEAVRVAVREGRLDVAGGLDLLPSERRDTWLGWVDAAESGSATLRPNGFTVTALQAAWAAIVSTQDDGDGVEPVGASSGSASGSQPGHLERALQAAVRIGDDTDTVAAIAGALLGARYGIEAIPAVWRADVHGWPGLRADDLIDLAVRTAESGRR